MANNNEAFVIPALEGAKADLQVLIAKHGLKKLLNALEVVAWDGFDSLKAATDFESTHACVCYGDMARHLAEAADGAKIIAAKKL